MKIINILILLFDLIYFVKSNTTCDTGWTLIEEKCVKFSSEKLTYHESVDHCSNAGGRLIEIHNSDASQTLATTAVTAFGVEQPDFWIGICEQQDHGLYVFESSGVSIKNENWAQSPTVQPDNLSKFEHCVHIYGTDGFWYDELCNIKKYFVCEDMNNDILFWRTCPLTWDLINKKCYHKASSNTSAVTNMNYVDAVAYCTENEAKLFEPSYKREEMKVIDFYSDSKFKSYWLGATDSTKEGRYKYQSNGYTVYYSNWLKNDTNDEPNNEGDCVVNSGGFWADESCSQTFEVICEEYEAPEVTPSANCSSDPGWHQIRDRCFYISPKKKKYYWAQKDCQNKGGRLFEPKHFRANHLIYEKVHANENIPYWIGVHDKKNPGNNDFIYAKSGKSVVFSQWDTLRGEPNKDMQNANCVQVQNHNGAWGDINCRAKRKFVCEIPSETHQPFWDDIKESTTDLKAEALRAYIFEKYLQIFPQRTTCSDVPEEVASKFLSVGGELTSGVQSKNVYLMNMQSRKACLHSELPDACDCLLVNIFRRRLLACSTEMESNPGTLQCYIWSHLGGWESFATPDGNTMSARTNSVTLPNYGIWYLDGSGKSCLLNEDTGDWEDDFISFSTSINMGCLIQISDMITARIGGENSNQIDILDWVTYPPTEILGYLNLGDVREMHQCVLMPKGIMGHPTVAIVGGNVYMELWDTVTNEIKEVAHPEGYEYETLLDASVMTYTDESIILTKASHTGFAEIFEYRPDFGWVKLQDSPTEISDVYRNGLYLLDDKTIEGFELLNTCQ